MKLYSQVLELKALRTITDGVGGKHGEMASTYLMAHLKPEHFYYEPCKAALQRLQLVARKRGRIPSFHEMVEDPGLAEEFRDILKSNRKKPVRDESESKALFDKLDEYRKIRVLFEMSRDTLEALKGSEVEVDKLLDKSATELARARSSFASEPLYTVGFDEHGADELLEDALSPESDVLIKTGFTEFDEKNGGLPAEGVVLLAATTSGGKSAMRMNLLKNIYKKNYLSVATISLEMNSRKETRRLLSNLTNIPFYKFNKKLLTDDERAFCRKKWSSFRKFGRKNKCRYSIICPTRSVSIQQALMLVKPYGYDVIAIDYVGLLEGASGDKQWQAMSDIVRECKIFSAENKCLIVLLAQLDSEDDRIRYSKGMLEHADGCWMWNYSKQEQRDLHVLPIRQLKARDAELFPFDLRENFAMMQVLNLDEDVPEGGSKGVSSPIESDSALEEDVP